MAATFLATILISALELSAAVGAESTVIQSPPTTLKNAQPRRERRESRRERIEAKRENLKQGAQDYLHATRNRQDLNLDQVKEALNKLKKEQQQK